MNINFSIIVCCYNSSKRLTKTLEAILLLKKNRDFKFEVIIVDNASFDNTIIIANRFCDQFKNLINCKVISENKKGLSNARKRGITESEFN
jgi:glycosyltransferase involved in cell wall biosynthesis